MRCRFCIALLLPFVLWLTLPYASTSAAQDATSRSSLTIHLPHDIAPERVAILYSLVQRGWPTPIATKPGIFDYTIETVTASNMKLLLFVPGFRVVTAEFTDAQVRATGRYTPVLVPSRATLSGRLVDSSVRPLRDYGLTLGYLFKEACDYFGCGMDGPIPVISLGDTRTDDAGAFSFIVPNRRDDPFFGGHTAYAGAGAFFLSSRTRGTTDLSGDDTLRPSLLPANAVDAPVVITHVDRGTLSGRLGKGFLRKEGLNDDLSTYDAVGEFYPSDHHPSRIAIGLYADSIDLVGPIDRSYLRLPSDITIEKDGTFERQLSPGTYNLRLLISSASGATQRTIWISKGLVVRENQRTVVEGR
jgi:hypothetical protein